MKYVDEERWDLFTRIAHNKGRKYYAKISDLETKLKRSIEINQRLLEILNK